MGTPMAKRLVREQTLNGVVDGRRRDRWIEYDPDWSRPDIWGQRVAKGFDFASDAEVERVVKLKIALRCGGVPFDDGFLLAFGRLRNGRRLDGVEARRRLRGEPRVYSIAAKRYAELHGGAARERMAFSPLELDEIIEEAPEPLRSLPGTCLSSARGILFEKPDLGQTSRVGAMPTDRLRWLATFAILVDPVERNKLRRIDRLLTLVDWMREELGPARAFEGAAVETLMRATLDPMHPKWADGLDKANSYLELRDLVAVYIEWQRPDPASELGAFTKELLLPDLSPDIRRLIGDGRYQLSARQLAARALTAGQVARRARQLLVSLHARFRQWDRLTERVESAIKEIGEKLDAGEAVDLPMGVSDDWKVMRPDGTIVTGLKQRVRLEIVSEEQALIEAAGACGWDPSIGIYMHADALAQAPGRLQRKTKREWAPIKTGPLHVPGWERRLFVRYVETCPTQNSDDEHHPPFLVPLYENSVLVSSMQMRADRLDVREAIVAENFLEPQPQAMQGLTWWTGRKNEKLPHLLLSRGGILLLPMSELRLALAYGIAVARMELLSGMRIGEIMQARLGAAIVEEPLSDGRIVITMRGRPKGWHRDRKWVIDRHTGALLRRIRKWVMQAWYADLDTLPFVAYGVPKKNETKVQCPRAQYLFQFAGYAATNREMNRCLRIATLGIVHARSHDYRYAFGKLLALRGGLRRHRAAAMSHDPRTSHMPERYGDWDCEGLDAADEFVADFQAAQLHEHLEDLIDVGAC